MRQINSLFVTSHMTEYKKQAGSFPEVKTGRGHQSAKNCIYKLQNNCLSNKQLWKLQISHNSINRFQRNPCAQCTSLEIHVGWARAFCLSQHCINNRLDSVMEISAKTRERLTVPSTPAVSLYMWTSSWIWAKCHMDWGKVEICSEVRNIWFVFFLANMDVTSPGLKRRGRGIIQLVSADVWRYITDYEFGNLHIWKGSISAEIQGLDQHSN